MSIGGFLCFGTFAVLVILLWRATAPARRKDDEDEE